MDSPRIIVFITGAYVSCCCWDDWKAYFESKGYACLVPAWPSQQGWRAGPHKGQPRASMCLPELLTYYTLIISQLPEKPILIAHSLSGLLARKLLDRNLAAAALALHAFPPLGVAPTASARATLSRGAPDPGLLRLAKRRPAAADSRRIAFQHTDY